MSGIAKRLLGGLGAVAIVGSMVLLGGTAASATGKKCDTAYACEKKDKEDKDREDKDKKPKKEHKVCPQDHKRNPHSDKRNFHANKFCPKPQPPPEVKPPVVIEKIIVVEKKVIVKKQVVKRQPVAVNRNLPKTDPDSPISLVGLPLLVAGAGSLGVMFLRRRKSLSS